MSLGYTQVTRFALKVCSQVVHLIDMHAPKLVYVIVSFAVLQLACSRKRMAVAASSSLPLLLMSGGEIAPPVDQRQTQFPASKSIRMSDAKYDEPGIPDYGKETKAGSSPIRISSKGREIEYLSSQGNLAICSNNSNKDVLYLPNHQPANSSTKEAPLVTLKSDQSPPLKGEWYINTHQLPYNRNNGTIYRHVPHPFFQLRLLLLKPYKAVCTNALVSCSGHTH